MTNVFEWPTYLLSKVALEIRCDLNRAFGIIVFMAMSRYQLSRTFVAAPTSNAYGSSITTNERTVLSGREKGLSTIVDDLFPIDSELLIRILKHVPVTGFRILVYHVDMLSRSSTLSAVIHGTRYNRCLLLLRVGSTPIHTAANLRPLDRNAVVELRSTQVAVGIGTTVLESWVSRQIAVGFNLGVAICSAGG
jgi:hypothetical protein